MLQSQGTFWTRRRDKESPEAADVHCSGKMASTTQQSRTELPRQSEQEGDEKKGSPAEGHLATDWQLSKSINVCVLTSNLLYSLSDTDAFAQRGTEQQAREQFLLSWLAGSCELLTRFKFPAYFLPCVMRHACSAA